MSGGVPRYRARPEHWKRNQLNIQPFRPGKVRAGLQTTTLSRKNRTTRPPFLILSPESATTSCRQSPRYLAAGAFMHACVTARAAYRTVVASRPGVDGMITGLCWTDAVPVGGVRAEHGKMSTGLLCLPARVFV